MDGISDKIQSFFQTNPIKKLIIIIGSFLAIIFLSFIIFSIITEPKVSISFSEKNSIPNSELTKVRKNLYGIIQDNSTNFDSNKTFKGVARDYQEKTENNKTGSATFFVDFDDIEQSYFVSLFWPDQNDGSPNIVISCPLLDSKYPNTPCKTESNSSSELINYLPYSKTLDSGEEYTVTYKYNNSDTYIEVQINSCGNMTLVESALTSAKEWIKSLNFNPNNYQIYAPTNLCDGEVHHNNTPQTTTNTYVTGNTLNTKDENVNNNLPYFIPNMYYIYPVTDDSGNVISIKAELSGCTNYQTDPMEEEVYTYLNNKNINYTVNFEYCRS